MFSPAPATCSRSTLPCPPIPMPAMLSLLLGDSAPRPRTRAGRNVNAATAVPPMKARREMPLLSLRSCFDVFIKRPLVRCGLAVANNCHRRMEPQERRGKAGRNLPLQQSRKNAAFGLATNYQQDFSRTQDVAETEGQTEPRLI